MKNIRYAARWLIHNRFFTAVTILTIAIAIGSITAIFGVINATLFPPLPYKNSDRLVEINEEKNRITLTDYEQLWELADFLESVGSYKAKVWNFAGYGEPARIPGYSISSSFLKTLRVQPILGRNFAIQDDKPGAQFVALISDEMWRAVFRSNPQIVGKVIRLDGQPCEIIGVMDANFRFPSFPVRQPQFWTTLGYEKDHLSQTAGRRVSTIGRLKPNVTMIEAQERLNLIAESFKKPGYKLRITRLSDFDNRTRGTNVSIHFLISAAALFVLFIACANVSNLLLLKSFKRKKEIAIRSALGASRFTLLKQLLTESILLCSLGGIVGFLSTFWLQNSLVIWMESFYPMAVNYWTGDYPNMIDTRVLFFTVVITIITGLATGITPALHGSTADLQLSLKEGNNNYRNFRTGTFIVFS